MIRVLFLLLLFTAPALSQTVGLASVRVYKFGGRNTQAANDDNLPDGSGSGWLISGSQVVTAYHVVHNNRGGNKQIQVRFPDGWRSWGVVEAYSLEHDLALVWINPHPSITKVPMSESMPDQGEEVTIHGYGYDYEYKQHKGVLWSRMRNSIADGQANKDWWYLQNYSNQFGKTDYDANGAWQAVKTVSIPGDSGGPVTYNGEVVGSVLSITPKVSVIVRIDTIKEVFGDKLHKSILKIK
jgi:hypothetical protein